MEGIDMLAYLEFILGKLVFFKTLVGEHCPNTFCLGKEGNSYPILNSFFHSSSFTTFFFFLGFYF